MIIKLEGQKDLRVCCVAFVDILGYKEQILKCGNDFNSLRKKLKTIQKQITPPQKDLQESLSVFQANISFFSDSTFINVPIHSDKPHSFSDGRASIGNTLDALARYQLELAWNDLFVRGCVTVNYGFADTSISFGPGLIEVVECEKKANHPRICITEDLMYVINYWIEKKWPGWENISDFLIKGDDQRVFINYLQPIIDEIEQECWNIPKDRIQYSIYKNAPRYIDHLHDHKKIIERNLKKNRKTEIKDKFVWLSNYHNWFCKKHFEDLDNLIITGYQEQFCSIS